MILTLTPLYTIFMSTSIWNFQWVCGIILTFWRVILQVIYFNSYCASVLRHQHFFNIIIDIKKKQTMWNITGKWIKKHRLLHVYKEYSITNSSMSHKHLLPSNKRFFPVKVVFNVMINSTFKIINHPAANGILKNIRW